MFMFQKTLSLYALIYILQVRRQQWLRPTNMTYAIFSPQHLSQYSPHSSWSTTSIGWWRQKHLHSGKQPSEQVHLSRKDLAFDFSMPQSTRWISHTGLATAATCQVLSFSTNMSSTRDPSEVKTINTRPGKNLKYSLNLHWIYNF